MLTRETLEQEARRLGAAKFGIGDLALFEGEAPCRDPKMICPKATCIVGFGTPVPKGLYKTMSENAQFYTYTQLGVKALDEEYYEIFLFRMASVIEDEGYDACLQRTTPNLRVKGDKTTNPEVVDTYELQYASPVEPGKPVPDIMIDFGKAAAACGIGRAGRYGKVVNREYGPFMRYAFIVTDAPLETNAPYAENLCDGCEACVKACPAKCIDADKGLDTWSCSVYYRGALGSNPFMTDDFLKGDPGRAKILAGEKRFTADEARAIYPKLKFLPRTQWGYAPCLCGKQCDLACYRHLTGREV